MSGKAARLGPAERRTALARMEEETFDVVVVGGGVTGAGVALDAASRGLATALVEARDYASGTSSRSSKLVHGGLRYLQQGNLRLVRQALRERTLQLNRLSPHLVRPVPFLYPLARPLRERAYVGTGVACYDLLAGRTGLPRHRHLSSEETRQLMPALRSDARIGGGIRYFDAQVDDARHTMALVRTAASHGAVCAAGARVVGVLRDGDRVAGVRVHDVEDGGELVVRGRRVVNATGVWSDDLHRLAGLDEERIRPTKGVHLVVPRERLPGQAGLILRTARSVLLAVPWPQAPDHRYWIIGTTDTDWSLDKAYPAASRSDIDYLLERVNQVLITRLGQGDIAGVYAGLRPLLAGSSQDTATLPREHRVWEPCPGLVTVAGGKYTTYRVMAAEAVDLAVRGLDGGVGPSRTHEVPLVGAEGSETAWERREHLAGACGLGSEQVARLVRRHGSGVTEVLDALGDREDLARPLPGGENYLRGEVRYAVSHEGALHLDDVLSRRTHVAMEASDRGVAAAEPAARLMAEVQGWTEQRMRREISHYHAGVAAQRDAERETVDVTGDPARLGSPDIRTA